MADSNAAAHAGRRHGMPRPRRDHAVLPPVVGAGLCARPVINRARLTRAASASSLPCGSASGSPSRARPDRPRRRGSRRMKGEQGRHEARRASVHRNLTSARQPSEDAMPFLPPGQAQRPSVRARTTLRHRPGASVIERGRYRRPRPLARFRATRRSPPALRRSRRPSRSPARPGMLALVVHRQIEILRPRAFG